MVFNTISPWTVRASRNRRSSSLNFAKALCSSTMTPRRISLSNMGANNCERAAAEMMGQQLGPAVPGADDPGRGLEGMPGLGLAERVELAGVAVRGDDRDAAVDQAPGQRRVGVPVGATVGVQRGDRDDDRRGEDVPQRLRGDRGQAHGLFSWCDSCGPPARLRSTNEVMCARSKAAAWRGSPSWAACRMA